VAEEPLDATAADPWGGTPPPDDVGQAGADAGDDEIEMPLEYVGQAGTDIGYNEIEMLSDDAGRVGADAGDGEIQMTPEYGEQAGADAHKKFVDGLYERYPKELAEDSSLQWEELRLQGYYKAISSLNTPEEPTLAEVTRVEEVYERLKTSIHEIEQKRDSVIQQVEESRRTEREELLKKEFEEEKRALQEDERPFYERLGFGDSDEDVVDHMDDQLDHPWGW
jgi:hypothetical protein